VATRLPLDDEKESYSPRDNGPGRSAGGGTAARDLSDGWWAVRDETPAGVNPDGSRGRKIELPWQHGEPKELRELRRRRSAIGLTVSGPLLPEQGPPQRGDLARVEREDGDSITLVVESVDERGVVTGAVARLDSVAPSFEIAGIRHGDRVRTHIDFVSIITRVDSFNKTLLAARNSPPR